MVTSKVKKGISGLLVCAMVLSVSFIAGPDALAAGKKARLAKTTLTLKKGSTAKIKIKYQKNSAKYKYTFKSKKPKIATVTKKGKVTGKKAGTTKIIVKEIFKKKPRKLGSVKIVVEPAKKDSNKNKTTDQPTSSKPAAASEKPKVSEQPKASEQPSDTPEEGWTETALSACEGTGSQYDEATKTLKISNADNFRFSLSKSVKAGQTLGVRMKIQVPKDSAGFRCWLGNMKNVMQSMAAYSTAEDAKFKPGEECVIEFDQFSVSTAKYIFFTGIEDGAKIDGLNIEYIHLHFSDKVETLDPPDPFAPETEQDANAENITLTESFSEHGGKLCNNPLMTQSFMADPTAIEYEGRLYIFGTADKVEFNVAGQTGENKYNTHELQCISSADLVNWTDHGTIDVKKVATWAGSSWAPSIVSKTVGGTTKFYLYFANGAGGIGVLVGDTPLGPWSDPRGKVLIDRSVANCDTQKVPWLFDPGVLVDDDGTGYIYFGGSSDTVTGPSHPKSARVAKLAPDMINLDGDPKEIDSPWMFEDNEINKIGDTYYYSYCTNWNSQNPNGGASIGYMTSKNPMTGFEFQGVVFKNPGSVFGNYYNNHHKLIKFKGKWYIVYHTTVLEERAYKSKQGYRTMHMDELTVGEDGTLSATATWDGLSAVETLDPYEPSGMTMAWNGGLTTVRSASLDKMVTDAVDTGDWLGLDNVDFGTDGAKSVTMTYASDKAEGSIEVWLDGASAAANGKKVGTLAIENTGGSDTFKDAECTLTEKVTGNHKVFYVFRGKGYHVASWIFKK